MLDDHEGKPVEPSFHKELQLRSLKAERSILEYFAARKPRTDFRQIAFGDRQATWVPIIMGLGWAFLIGAIGKKVLGETNLFSLSSGWEGITLSILIVAVLAMAIHSGFQGHLNERVCYWANRSLNAADRARVLESILFEINYSLELELDDILSRYGDSLNDDRDHSYWQSIPKGW